MVAKDNYRLGAGDVIVAVNCPPYGCPHTKSRKEIARDVHTSQSLGPALDANSCIYPVESKRARKNIVHPSNLIEHWIRKGARSCQGRRVSSTARTAAKTCKVDCVWLTAGLPLE